ncbi:methyl-accepting chemotaxis protein, partial [Pseudomonas sp. MWU12-2312b]
MNIFNQSKFSTKLLAAFVICALITLAVGTLGMVGVSRLATALSLTFSNNLVSAANTNETMASLIAHNRGLFRLLDAQVGDVAEADKMRVRQALATDLARAEKAFAAYRTTPMEEDEQEAGEKYEELWSAYVTGSQKILELIDAGDYVQARARLHTLSLDVFSKARECLRVMIDSTNRQIKEAADAAQELKASSTRLLLIGIAVAFLVAITLGVLITRMITR